MPHGHGVKRPNPGTIPARSGRYGLIIRSRVVVASASALSQAMASRSMSSVDPLTALAGRPRRVVVSMPSGRRPDRPASRAQNYHRRFAYRIVDAVVRIDPLRAHRHNGIAFFTAQSTRVGQEISEVRSTRSDHFAVGVHAPIHLDAEGHRDRHLRNRSPRANLDDVAKFGNPLDRAISHSKDEIRE